MKRFLIFLLLIFGLIFISGCNNTEEQPDINKETEGETEVETDKFIDKASFKVLSIGNSFSDNATKYLYQIAKAYGFEEVVVGNLYIGNCDIETHRKNAVLDLPNYIYRKASVESNGVIVNTPNYTLKNGILDEDWQYIVLQQQSSKSGFAATYELVPNLVEYVKENATYKEVKLFWHMTWADAWESSNPEFSKFENDQYIMYESVINAIKEEIVPNTDFVGIIPVGTAIQNVRTSYVGDTLTNDGHHLNTKGEYVAGMMFVLSLTGITNDDFDSSTLPYEIKIDLDVYKESTTNAIAEPYNITLSNILERPY